MDKSFSPAVLALGLIIFVMYGFVCRVVAREWMKGMPLRRVFGVCWAVGVVVFGTYMQLTVPEDAWTGAAFFVAPLAALMALAAAGK